MFNDAVLKIEGNQTSAIETIRYIRELQNSLERRREDNFLSTRADNAKDELVVSGVGRAELEGQCKQFFGKIYIAFGVLFQLLMLSNFQMMLWSTSKHGRNH